MADSILSRVEPSAVGSMLVLVALIGAIGFGGWSVLQEVQRVQVAPVDQTPIVLSDLDPLDGALSAAPETGGPSAAPAAIQTPRAEALDRLYRPQALDVPVLIARDAPISTIDPRSVGNFASPERAAPTAALRTADGGQASDTLLQVAGAVPQVVEGAADIVRMVAAYPSWVRVTSADGSVIFEKVMNKGDVYEIPATQEPPTLRTGESGALYFALADTCVGPVGARGSITSNLPLQREALAELYVPVDPTQEPPLNRMFADLAGSDIDPTVLAAMPCQTR